MERYEFGTPQQFPATALHEAADRLRAALPRVALLLGSLVRRPVQVALDQVEAGEVSADQRFGLVIETDAGTRTGVLGLSNAVVVGLAETLMGGPGTVDVPRPPVDLERGVVARQLSGVLAPLTSALDGATDVRVKLLATAADAGLLLAGIDLAVGDLQGRIELAVPASLLTSGPTTGSAAAVLEPTGPLADALADVPVALSVSFPPVLLDATELDALAVGDVIRLDHPLGAPLRGTVGDQAVLIAHAGRRGRRLAVEVEEVVA